MANLVITTSAAKFKTRTPRALTMFMDNDKNRVIAMPSVKNKKVSWTIPDTSENRDLFRKNYEPSGLYGCKSIDLAKPEEFEVIAEAEKKKSEDTEEKANV